MRFRRVCPLLVETPGGLRCSVNTADVRPFWGRAFGYLGGGSAAIYLILTLTFFVTLRVIGYPVSYGAVAWPPSWVRINEVRGQYFFRKGVTALATNNIKVALFSLSQAYALAPRDYEIGFTLASLRQATNPAVSDRIYGQLLVEHPERNDQIADAWSRSLLARGDYKGMKALAADQLMRTAPNHLGYWMQSLTFASRQSGDPATLQRILAGQPKLESQWRKVLSSQVLIQTGHPETAIPILRQVWPDATHPFVPFYQVKTLIELGQSRFALELLDRYGPRFRDDERYRLRLDACASLGWRSLLTSDVDLLLASPTGPVFELLGAHLIRYPDEALLNRVFDHLLQSPLPAIKENHNAYGTLFCAAGIAGDFAKTRILSKSLKQIASSSFVALDGLEDFFRGQSHVRHIEAFLPSIPLPLDTTYALLKRYSGPRPAAITLGGKVR